VVRRRRWSDEEKGRIVAEAIAPGAVISDVARRHDLAPQQLSNLIRAGKEGQFALPADEMPAFVPVVPVESAQPSKAAHERRSAAIEIVIGTIKRAVPRRETLKRCCARFGARTHERRSADSARVRVLVATKPVDFRKGIDGLVALVKEQLQADPFSGVIFCFRAKRADRVKKNLLRTSADAAVGRLRYRQGHSLWPQALGRPHSLPR
jgi:transposase-like protein